MAKLFSAINLLKVEIQVFSGDPLKYLMRAFDLNVDQICSDDNMKLRRLIQYCSGPARDALDGCMLISGSGRYKRARKILEERFGNPHRVTERIVSNIRYGKSVRTPQELLQFSCF